MPSLLLELFSEEIPARMQARAAEDLGALVSAGLSAAGLAHGAVRKFVAPRRLGVAIDGIPAQRADRHEERRGPRRDAPRAALEGFLRSTGLASLDQCELREVKGVPYYFAAIARPGGATVEALPDIVDGAIRALAWPRTMRWASTRFAYVRPLHNILCRFDRAIVPGSFDCGGGTILPFNGVTFGHRHLSPGPIEAVDADAYVDALRHARVIVDRQARREAIREGATALAAARGLALVDDAALLEEVTGLVDWPVPLIGRIDQASMSLPREVLVTSMRNHQRYFALADGDGGMAPFFLAVANMETADRGAAIVAGNESVLRARLADARFFWDQDRKVPLASRRDSLDAVTWHARLGSIGDKVRRIEGLAAAIAASVPGADQSKVRRAALLAKADLVTGMVGEFPELQGIMGRHYALHDGEDGEVAEAIAQHWGPLGPGDACPSAPVSVALALSDKIDTLAGFWRIGETPTGSRDPYGLRRAALGVIRLVLENRLRLALRPLFAAAGRAYVDAAGGARPALPDDLLAFLADRLEASLRDQGKRHDLVSAVFAVAGEDDLLRLLARVEALAAFMATEDGRNLLIAYRRAANIVRIEAKKDKLAVYDGPIDPVLLVEPEESQLVDVLDRVAAASDAALGREDFVEAMRLLASLRAPVDEFFEKVTVNAPDPALRANRLRLLQRIGSFIDRIAVFARIEG